MRKNLHSRILNGELKKQQLNTVVKSCSYLKGELSLVYEVLI